MIELSGVKKIFNQGKPNEYIAIERVDLEIESRRITVLKGPSGSGKTSLLSIIGCMSRPTAGRVSVAGREITSLPERFLAEIRRKTFGFVFQQFHLINGITVLENILLPAYPSGVRFGDLKKRGESLLRTLDIPDKSHAKTEWLSGGEIQRVCIARALINDPEIVIADEPTAHLDSKLSAEFMAIAARLRDEGKTILIASHDPVVYDSRAVDRIVKIRDGKIEN